MGLKFLIISILICFSFQQETLLHTNGSHPLLTNMQYMSEWKQLGFGFGCLFEFDISLGYEILFMHLFTTQHNLLLNPLMFIEATTHNYI